MSVRQGVRWRWLPGLSAFDHGDVSRKHVGEPHLILDTRQNFVPVSQLGGKRGPPRPSQSKLAMLVPPTQLPLSTKRFVCVVSFELHNSLLRVGTAIIPILEKEMEAQRGIVIVIGLVLA